MKLDIIVPAYNEEGNVKKLYEKIKETLKKEKFRIIFVNDGSEDKTYEELKELFKADKDHVRVIDFSRNFGKEAGIYAGMKNSTGDYVSIIDVDLQQPPKVVFEMLEILENNEEYDAVAAYQVKRKDSFLKKHFSNMFYKIINKVADIELKSGASDFRLLRKKVVDSILEIKEYFRFSKGIFSWVGFNTYYIEYEPLERVNGTTKWSLKKLFKYAFDGILSYTTFPIRIATIIGSVLSVLSFIYLIITIIQKLAFGINVPGYASLLGISLLLGGIQLLFLGIIGEYIARIYIETKERPIYIAKQIITNSKEKKD